MLDVVIITPRMARRTVAINLTVGVTSFQRAGNNKHSIWGYNPGTPGHHHTMPSVISGTRRLLGIPGTRGGSQSFSLANTSVLLQQVIIKHVIFAGRMIADLDHTSQ